MWVFANGHLIIDLGGVHATESQSVNLDAVAAAAGMSKGQNYPLDIFGAERHTCASDYSLTTTLVLGQSVSPSPSASAHRHPRSPASRPSRRLARCSPATAVNSDAGFTG